MAEQLEAKAEALPHVELDMLPGFAAHGLVYEGTRVIGVQVVEQSTGSPDEDNLYAKVTALGDKGFVSQDLVKRFQLRRNPQRWSVGVKELWALAPETANALKGHVWHTMGYPVLDGSFGGGFVYGMDDNRLTLGMVAVARQRKPEPEPATGNADVQATPVAP